MQDILAIIGAIALLWVAGHIFLIVYDSVVQLYQNRISLKEENRRLKLEIFGLEQGIRRLQEELRKTKEGK